jgi:glutathione S-transferase
MVTLYHAPGASSFAVLIALHEVGAPFETRLIRLDRRADDPPEFRSLNAEGKVPTLLIDGRPLTEVAGILWYLARCHPAAGLLPLGDIEAEARIVGWMSFIASALHPARQLEKPQAQAVYQVAEQRLGAGPWVLGPSFSIADIHLFRLFWRFRGPLAVGAGVSQLDGAPGADAAAAGSGAGSGGGCCRRADAAPVTDGRDPVLPAA